MNCLSSGMHDYLAWETYNYLEDDVHAMNTDLVEQGYKVGDEHSVRIQWSSNELETPPEETVEEPTSAPC